MSVEDVEFVDVGCKWKYWFSHLRKFLVFRVLSLDQEKEEILCQSVTCGGRCNVGRGKQ
jgi:hypothetical protein